MNLVDSSAWLEYFADGKNAEDFAPVIEDKDNLIVSAINIYEVYKKILSERDQSSALEAIALMQHGTVVDVNASISVDAANISHEMKLPMADSIIYATAIQTEAVVWTQDSDFSGLKGVNYIAK